MSESSQTDPRATPLPFVALALTLASLFLTARATGPRWSSILEPALAIVAVVAGAIEQRRAPRPFAAAVALLALTALAAEIALGMVAQA